MATNPRTTHADFCQEPEEEITHDCLGDWEGVETTPHAVNVRDVSVYAKDIAAYRDMVTHKEIAIGQNLVRMDVFDARALALCLLTSDVYVD